MNKPCKNCNPDGATGIFTDGEDFWKWDPEKQLYRMVAYDGNFYPIHSHPGASAEQLIKHFGSKLHVSTEVAIMWRTINYIQDGLLQNNIM